MGRCGRALRVHAGVCARPDARSGVRARARTPRASSRLQSIVRWVPSAGRTPSKMLPIAVRSVIRPSYSASRYVRVDRQVHAGLLSGAAGGSGGSGCVVARPAVAPANRVGVERRGGQSWSPDDSDGGLCAFDGGQAAHRLGIRDAGARGLGLAASAAFLPDRARRAGAARVDGAQANQPARWRGGGRADALCDRKGPARDALCGQGGEDRLDCSSMWDCRCTDFDSSRVPSSTSERSGARS